MTKPETAAIQNKFIEVISPCIGWEKGLTVGELAKKLFDQDTPENRARASAAKRRLRVRLRSEGKVLATIPRSVDGTGNGKKRIEWRTFIVSAEEEARTTLMRALSYVRSWAKSYRGDSDVLEPTLNEGTRQTVGLLAQECVSVLLKLPPPQQALPEGRKRRREKAKGE